MRNFHLTGNQITESDALPLEMPAQGFLWLGFSRREFEIEQPKIQSLLRAFAQIEVLDLHYADLISNQLPSHYDYTSVYDILIFRRLAKGRTESDPTLPGQPLNVSSGRKGPPILRKIDTSPIGYLLMDRIILTVHPTDCAVRDAFADRLLHNAASTGGNHLSARLPFNPADLMLRMMGLVVDGYLDLRKDLTRQLDHWQSELIDPNNRFNNWSALLESRMALHHLEEIGEEQRVAVQDWIESLNDWTTDDTLNATELELIKVRSRDVLEHIERVIHHVTRLEQSAETAVQMHFNIQSNRNNDVMKTLTALTAIFLPLNLITGFFGMNFENFPFLKNPSGLELTEGFMLVTGVLLAAYFASKKYLTADSSHR